MKTLINVFGDDAILRFWGEFAVWAVAVFAIFAVGVTIF